MGYKSVESDFCYIVFVFKYCFVQFRCIRPFGTELNFSLISGSFPLASSFQRIKCVYDLQQNSFPRFDHLVKKESNIMLFSSGLAAAPFPHRKSPFPSPRIHNICLLLFTCSFLSNLQMFSSQNVLYFFHFPLKAIVLVVALCVPRAFYLPTYCFLFGQ